MGRPIRFILEDFPEVEDYLGGVAFEASGRMYVDPETGEPIIKVVKPPMGTESQKIRKAAKVARHEIGHSALHLPRYSAEDSIRRETDPKDWLQDEVEVAVWEYGIDGKIGALKRNLTELAEARLRWFKGEAQSREMVYERVAEMAEGVAEDILGTPLGIRFRYGGTMRKGFIIEG